MTRESYTRVLEYLAGTLNLTVYPRLTSCERITFSPAGSAGQFIAAIHDRIISDAAKLELLEHEDLELWP